MKVLAAALLALITIPSAHAVHMMYYTAVLNGTSSSGMSNMTLNKDTNQLNLTISENLVGADALTATNKVVGVHIHMGNATESGPIVWSFCGADPAPACEQSTNDVTYVGYPYGSYTAESATKLLLDGTPAYVAFHTTTVPGGLMRGQVEKDKRTS